MRPLELLIIVNKQTTGVSPVFRGLGNYPEVVDLVVLPPGNSQAMGG